eukprot:s1220_g5.t1
MTKDTTTGRTFWIFNTHWCVANGNGRTCNEGVRYTGAKNMLRVIQSKAGNSPVVVTGDFNADMDEDGPQHFFKNGFKLAVTEWVDAIFYTEQHWRLVAQGKGDAAQSAGYLRLFSSNPAKIFWVSASALTVVLGLIGLASVINAVQMELELGDVWDLLDNMEFLLGAAALITVIIFQITVSFQRQNLHMAFQAMKAVGEASNDAPSILTEPMISAARKAFLLINFGESVSQWGPGLLQQGYQVREREDRLAFSITEAKASASAERPVVSASWKLVDRSHFGTRIVHFPSWVYAGIAGFFVMVFLHEVYVSRGGVPICQPTNPEKSIACQLMNLWSSASPFVAMSMQVPISLDFALSLRQSATSSGFFLSCGVITGVFAMVAGKRLVDEENWDQFRVRRVLVIVPLIAAVFSFASAIFINETLSSATSNLSRFGF